MTKQSSPSYKCEYCGKAFKRDSTLLSHTCEPKRRVLQEKEQGVQWGLRAFVKFYDVVQPSVKTKTYADFMKSPYYLAFVRYGRYCIDVKCVNFDSYTDWNLKNNIRLENWYTDSNYDKWLPGYLLLEDVQDALARSLEHIQKIEQDGEIKSFCDYFRYYSTNVICHDIAKGKVSPWVMFNSDSGQEFLSKLNEDQLQIVLSYVDLDKWNIKFKRQQEDVKWCQQILMKAGM